MNHQHGPQCCVNYNKSVSYFLEKLQLHLSEVKDQFTMMKFAANHCHNLQQQGELPTELAILPKEIRHDQLYLIFGLLRALDKTN
jgi:hypothetical protein